MDGVFSRIRQAHEPTLLPEANTDFLRGGLGGAGGRPRMRPPIGDVVDPSGSRQQSAQQDQTKERMLVRPEAPKSTGMGPKPPKRRAERNAEWNVVQKSRDEEPHQQKEQKPEDIHGGRVLDFGDSGSGRVRRAIFKVNVFDRSGDGRAKKLRERVTSDAVDHGSQCGGVERFVSNLGFGGTRSAPCPEFGYDEAREGNVPAGAQANARSLPREVFPWLPVMP